MWYGSGSCWVAAPFGSGELVMWVVGGGSFIVNDASFSVTIVVAASHLDSVSLLIDHFHCLI